MAGSYPDVPGYRFAYDQDGTVVVHHDSSLGYSTLVSSANTRQINSENTAGLTAVNNGAGVIHRYIFLFPERRNIVGILVNHGGNLPLQSAEWSDDTTNGIDGTWHTVAGISAIASVDRILLRTSINSTSVTNATALRLNHSVSSGNRFVRNIHLYGSIAPAESLDRLRIIDMVDDDISAQLDFGNLTQRASSTRQFKVKNNSATLNANNITVSLDAPTNASPSLIGQYQVSTDNVAFANAVNIGTLAPGAESGILYVRMNPASNAQLGPWTARIIAHPTSWS